MAIAEPNRVSGLSKLVSERRNATLDARTKYPLHMLSKRTSWGTTSKFRRSTERIIDKTYRISIDYHYCLLGTARILRKTLDT